MGRIKQLILGLCLLFSTSVFADSFNSNCTNSQNCFDEDIFIYEGSQDLIDLYNMSGTTNLNSNDDSMSGKVNLGFTFDRWGYNWTEARMSTNGCVNFSGRSDGKNSANCQDYTPQALPYRNFTLYPLWTDLIRGQSSSSGCNNTWCTSKMLFKAFDDYVVFGWYYMREYNRQSSNSFEAILYHNDTYEFRYRELDIIQHDVLIGEQGFGSAQKKTYLFYNDNQSGYNNFDQFLAGYGGPDIENGGSLYSEGLTLAQHCAADPLYSTECSGYADAYFTQQCGLDPLYNNQCTGYAAAYETQQCGLDPLYSENCTGYAAATFLLECQRDPLYDRQCDGYFEELAYQESLDDMMNTDSQGDMYGYDDGFDEYGQDEDAMYGYDDNGDAWSQDDMWYDAEYDEYLDPNDPCYQNACENFSDADWYALDVEQFGQEQVDEWYGAEPEFDEGGFLDFSEPGSEEAFLVALDANMEQYDLEEMMREEEQYMMEEEIFAMEEIFILEEEGGLEIMREEEWMPVDEFIEEFSEEDFIEALEDYEREDLEEFVEEMEEIFEEEINLEVLEELIDDEAFEELIDTEELEELLNEEPEELFEEEEMIEEEEIELDREVDEITPDEVEASEPEQRKPSRASRVIAKLRNELGKEAAAVVSQQVSSGSGSSSSGSSGVTYNGGSQGSTGTLVSSDTSGDSFQLDQQEQATGQVSIDVGQTDVGGPAVSAFEVAEQQQDQQVAQSEFTFEAGGDSFGGGSAEFENTFNDAIGTGQSIGQFLSNEAPNFTKFDVAPPTVSEQRTTKAVENLAERLGEEAAMENLQAQLEQGEDGETPNQTIAVAVIGYKAGFSAYTGMEQLTDQPDWYQVKALYTNAKIDDNKYSMYMMAGKSDLKMQEMILSQYKE